MRWAAFANPELEAVLTSAASLLVQRGWSMASAESCTGGLIAAACTEYAGASTWFERGFVCYSAAAKIQQLGVASALLAQRGMVHEEVALAMAAGALIHSGAQVSVAVTGLAGPACDGSGRLAGLVSAQSGRIPTATVVALRHGAAGGTRQGLMLRRSARWADCAVVLAPGSCRITHSAPWRALRSDRCGKSEHEARFASAPTPALRSSPPHKSPLPGAACRAGPVGLPQRQHRRCPKAGPGQAAMRL